MQWGASKSKFACKSKAQKEQNGLDMSSASMRLRHDNCHANTLTAYHALNSCLRMDRLASVADRPASVVDRPEKNQQASTDTTTNKLPPTTQHIRHRSRVKMAQQMPQSYDSISLFQPHRPPHLCPPVPSEGGLGDG